MVELNMEHVLILVIAVFLLYHLMNRCGNNFSVGAPPYPYACNLYTDAKSCENIDNILNCSPDACWETPYKQHCSKDCQYNPTCKWFGKDGCKIKYFPNEGPKPEDCVKEAPGGVCHDDTDCAGYRTCGSPVGMNWGYCLGDSFCSCDIDYNSPDYNYTKWAFEGKCNCPDGYKKVNTHIAKDGPAKGKSVARCKKI